MLFLFFYTLYSGLLKQSTKKKGVGNVDRLFYCKNVRFVKKISIKNFAFYIQINNLYFTSLLRANNTLGLFDGTHISDGTQKKVQRKEQSLLFYLFKSKEPDYNEKLFIFSLKNSSNSQQIKIGWTYSTLSKVNAYHDGG